MIEKSYVQFQTMNPVNGWHQKGTRVASSFEQIDSVHSSATFTADVSCRHRMSSTFLLISKLLVLNWLSLPHCSANCKPS